MLGLIDKRVAGPEPPRYALFDTPGQIEIFTWSASGAIITESLAATYPTVIVYVVDTARCKNAVTFMSNMLYACSILYKLKLPLVPAGADHTARPPPPIAPTAHSVPTVGVRATDVMPRLTGVCARCRCSRSTRLTPSRAASSSIG